MKSNITARIERLEKMTDGGYSPIVLEQVGDGKYVRVGALHAGEPWTDADIAACEWTVIIIDI